MYEFTVGDRKIYRIIERNPKNEAYQDTLCQVPSSISREKKSQEDVDELRRRLVQEAPTLRNNQVTKRRHEIHPIRRFKEEVYEDTLCQVPSSISREKKNRGGGLSFLEVAGWVYGNRDKLCAQAIDKSLQEKRYLDLFVDQIQEKFKDHDHSLSDLAVEHLVRERFFQSKKLRLVVWRYASKTNSQGLLDKHLLWVVNDIYNRRDEIVCSKGNIIRENLLLISVRQAFHAERRSMRDLRHNFQALNVLNKSARLSKAVQLYFRSYSKRQGRNPKIVELKHPKPKNGKFLNVSYR